VCHTCELFCLSGLHLKRVMVTPAVYPRLIEFRMKGKEKTLSARDQKKWPTRSVRNGWAKFRVICTETNERKGPPALLRADGPKSTESRETGEKRQSPTTGPLSTRSLGSGAPSPL